MRLRVRSLAYAVLAGGLLVSCNGGTPVTTPASFGTVSGTVSSSLGGGLANVSVVLTPTGGSAMAAVTTNGSGAFSVANVPIGTAGTGSISVSGVPLNCAPPASTTPYTGLTASTGATVNVPVTCATPLDTLAGTITSSLGGAVAGVSVVVTPTGGTALAAMTTSASGTFTAAGIATNGGTITLSNIPSNCVTPTPISYTGVATGGPVSQSITLQCSAAAAAITGTLTSSQGGSLAGVSVVVTPHGQNAMPAVTTNSAGVYTVTGVQVSDGTGAIAFSTLPSNCPTPASPTSYTGLTASAKLTVNATITCNPPSGTIIGTITSSLGGGLASVGVVVTPAGGSAMPAVTTSNTGTFTVSNVLIGTGAQAGTGTVTVNHLQLNCTAPASPSSYTGLANSTTDTVNITIQCTTPYGTVKGTIVTAWGTPIQGVTATVTPTGGQGVTSSPSDTNGLFVVTGVPVGPGTGQVTFAGLTINCQTPSPQPYTGLTNTRSVNLYVVPPCTKTGAINLAILSGGGNAPTTTANVSITGSGPGLPVTLTAPGLVYPLNPGAVVLTASNYQSFDQTVPQIFYPDTINLSHRTFIDTTVTIGKVDSITVTYAWREGSGELWIADSSSTLLAGFSGPQLRQGGTITASNLITQPAFVAPTGMALDSNNKLWVSQASANQVLEYRDSAEFGGVNASYVFRTVSGFNNPQGLAFDASDNLWVANAGNNTLSMIVGGSIAATLSSTALNQPTGLAFDANGNLWVTNPGNNTVVAFSASELSSAGSETPTVVLSASGGSLATPTALAFDASGAMWVTNASANTVVSFTSAMLASSGSPTPAVTISANTGSLAAPRALAFDASGNLWVANETSSNVVEFSTAQLASGGSLAATTTVTSQASELSGPLALVFNPQPTGLPINGSHVKQIFRPGVKITTKSKVSGGAHRRP
ncbi:MAG TPA: hypothetical protein VFA43_11495 [Gemmatimonadaceae bacterium]|nr:hypothetical protein [Gemmatimonadaceae bacterium]